MRVFPHRLMAFIVEYRVAQRVAIAEQHRKARTIRAKGDAPGRHHVRAIREKGDAAKAFRLALGQQQAATGVQARSEEHTSELQSLMRISYAVFCLKKKKQVNIITKIYK